MRKETFDNCELYCGDCMDIMPTLPDASVDLVLTDPPYNLNWKGAVLQKLNGKIVKVWSSQREAWRKLHLQQSMLSQALTGKSKTAYGFTWEYANTHENPELLER